MTDWPVHRIAATIPLPEFALDDRLCFDCLMIGLGSDLWVLTTAEKRSGYKRVTCRSGHENRVKVGWRAKKAWAEQQAKRDAEMAACPFVACECGHHEDYG